MKQKSPILYILGAILLYLVSTGISYGAFSLISGGSAPTKVALPSGGKGRLVIDPSIPRTEVCPLNGAKFTKQERDIWETRRPLAVMIENHEEARPQTGLSYADIVYEAVAEGGITRFMGIYYCGIAAYDIGLAPVRSARTYFVDWVSEYDALYAHVGGAGRCSDDTVDPRAKALCQIEKYGIKDMDQFGLPIRTKDAKNTVCVRNYDRLDHEVATEHTMVCYSDGLYLIAQERSWTNVDEEGVAWNKNYTPWKFQNDGESSKKGTVKSFSFTHWKGYEDQYGVQWDYDETSNSYKRSNGGKPHLDLETNQQLTAKNIVVQFTKETDGIDEHAHILYGTIGNGEALIFQNGDAIKGTWKKLNRLARTVFYDDKGKEIAFVPGQIWIEVIAIGTEVKY